MTTSDVLAGIRVVELATWTFVPAAGAVLADWGADVIKIEHPIHGDPQRGLMMSGMLGNQGSVDVNFVLETPNRGKRSVGIDMTSEAGRAVFAKLILEADVFLTNLLPGPRKRLGVEVSDLQAINPKLIYARGHGFGVRGEEAESGSYDTSAFWARSGLGLHHSPVDADYPSGHSPALGDLISGMTLAGGVAGALLHRERTGKAKVVDVSLLNTGMWAMSPGIVAAGLYEIDDLPRRPDRRDVANPISNFFRAKDGRLMSLVMLNSQQYWGPLCVAIGRPDLVDDPRFASAQLRAANSTECVELLDAAFAQRTFDEWKPILDGFAVWSPVLTPRQLHSDPQVEANGYLATLKSGSGAEYRLVTTPVQFDETPATPTRAPELGENTEEIMLELGYGWDEIVNLKDSGTIT